MYRPKHFILQELVCEDVYREKGQSAWSYFDPRLLETIDWLRDQLGPIYANNWDMRGQFTQRGYRCTTCQLIKQAVTNKIVYCTAHLGQALDFDVKGMTAEKARQWIIENQDRLLYPVRLETGVNWVHLDVRDGGQKVTLINPSRELPPIKVNVLSLWKIYRAIRKFLHDQKLKIKRWNA